MGLRWYATVVDCRDVAAQARWWAEALGWRIDYEAPDEVVIVPAQAADEQSQVPVEERGPVLVFVPVPEARTVKASHRSGSAGR